MDIRLFKFVVFLIGEAVAACFLLGGSFFVRLGLFPENYPIFVFVFMGLIALFAISPEDAWIWLVEEDLRNKKISLRKKACKHLELSLLYCLLFSTPPFVISMGMVIGRHEYVFPATYVAIFFAVLFGLLGANLTFNNVRQYAAVFAVGWDRRVSFLEIFFGVTATRSARLFFHGGYLLYMVVLCIGSLFLPSAYSRFRPDWLAPYDRERSIVLASLFHFSLASSVWLVSMYFFFQFLYVRKLEEWVQTRRRRQQEDADEQERQSI